MKKVLFLFSALVMTSVPSFGADILRATDDFRLSWREFSASRPGRYSVSIEVKVCAGQSDAQRVTCAQVGQFEASELQVSDDREIDIKRNTDKVKGTEINRLAQTVARGIQNPLIRLMLSYKLHTKANPTAPVQIKLIDEEYVAFPPLSQTASNERKVIQERVVLQGDGLRSRVLVEIYRP